MHFLILTLIRAKKILLKNKDRGEFFNIFLEKTTLDMDKFDNLSGLQKKALKSRMQEFE